MVIDDDDIALNRALMHQGEKASLELGTLLPCAHIPPRVEFRPDGTVFGKVADIRPIARLRSLFPLPDNVEIRDLLET